MRHHRTLDLVVSSLKPLKFMKTPPPPCKQPGEVTKSSSTVSNKKRKQDCLRRLERVYHCCSVCEMLEDYKEGYLMGWANYMSPCNSIAGLYFEGTCDIISVTMAMHKVHKNVH